MNQHVSDFKIRLVVQLPEQEQRRGEQLEKKAPLAENPPNVKLINAASLYRFQMKKQAMDI